MSATMPANFLDALYRLLSQMQVKDAELATDLLNQFFDEIGWQLDDDGLIPELAEHLIDSDQDGDTDSFDAYWERLCEHATKRGISHLVKDPEDFIDMHKLNIDPVEIADQLILRAYGETETSH